MADDLAYQGIKIGPGLLKDALLRSKSISDQIGIKETLVHALSEEAKNLSSSWSF